MGFCYRLTQSCVHRFRWYLQTAWVFALQSFSFAPAYPAGRLLQRALAGKSRL